jgi:hydrogenase maturation protease
MLDEGVGIRIAQELDRNYRFPPDVRVMDAGTMGLGMMHLFRGVEFLLVADAVDGTSLPPGTVVRFDPDGFSSSQVLHSLHDVRFSDVLEAAKLIDLAPQAECIGVQVADMSPPELTIGLTPVVEAAVPRAVAAVLYVLEEHGVAWEPVSGAEADPAFQALVAEHKADIARKQAQQAADGTHD